MSKLSQLFQENKFTPGDVPAFENKLFFEGSRKRPYLVRFAVLLFLSTIIASYGVINDSTATVIGAMIIAPLMTPIMAQAAAIVMGNRERAIHSVIIVVCGVLLVVALSALIGWLESQYSIISFSNNKQITGRISPRYTDLIVALASGAAGAFAMSRDDISDSLPGVAISISLVPPLCVAGIGLSNGEWSGAGGSMLLFLTNYLSILLAGGLFLAILGLEKATNVDLDKGERRRTFTVILVGVLLISIPLLSTSVKVAKEANLEILTSKTAEEWIEGSDYELREVRVRKDEVNVLIVGEGMPPSSAELVTVLEGKYSEPVFINLEIVPLQDKRLEVIPSEE